MSANSRLAPELTSKPISRREFLFYVSGASMALFSAGTCAVVYQVAQTDIDFRLRSDVFAFEPQQLKPTSPFFFREAQAYVVANNGQLTALDIHCKFPHDRWYVVWVRVNERFECPVCGSKYQLDGSWIAGPAPHGLDHLVIYVETPQGIIHTPQDGSPVPIADATRIWVDTRTKILGQPRE